MFQESPVCGRDEMELWTDIAIKVLHGLPKTGTGQRLGRCLQFLEGTRKHAVWLWIAVAKQRRECLVGSSPRKKESIQHNTQYKLHAHQSRTFIRVTFSAHSHSEWFEF